MPPKMKTSKQMILDAAFELVRRDGHEKLSVRNLAQELGCSTQPILYQFQTVDELRAEVFRMADEYHTRFILPGEDVPEPFLALGLNYIRFGSEEKNLFRFLYQSSQPEGQELRTLFGKKAVPLVLSTLSRAARCSKKEARELFSVFFITAHGCASLIANNAMTYNEAACEMILRRIFTGMTGRETAEPAEPGSGGSSRT